MKATKPLMEFGQHLATAPPRLMTDPLPQGASLSGQLRGELRRRASAGAARPIPGPTRAAFLRSSGELGERLELGAVLDRVPGMV